ncbi:hypothetical protein ELH90_12540 [Rhizobium leguminosarum]|uniref:Uncharacterized protein n=1 Tax=Rhizobium leguminosarum TaxID=384 RepID=A0A7M3DUU6_RHILE|nr:hypothetical protein ELH90_12540 [Rhizobium leguminosarum]
MRGLHGTPFHHNLSVHSAAGAWRVVGKTGVADPLIRPTGTFSPRGEEGVERSRHAPLRMWRSGVV